MIDRNLDALPAGLVLDGYRIERELGSGGFGITYLATEIESGRQVAIKEYMPKAFARRGANDLSVRPVDSEARPHFDWGLERFRDEARSLIRLNHPNIVQTLRLFSAHGTAYIVMNYVDGESLNAVVKRAGTLSAAEIEDVLPPLLDGLAAVHAAGYLHRDLKPANIYIRRSDGEPILLDFGAAREALGRETQTLSAIVTPGFSPPEQYGRGAKQKETADIYALGATLYRCVAGEAPPEAPDRVTAMVTGQPDPLLPAAEAGRGQYSPGLLAAIDRALSIRDDERPQSVAAIRALLRGAAPAPRPPVSPKARIPSTSETLLAGEVPGPSQPNPAPRAIANVSRSGARPAARKRGIVFAGALVLAAVVGAAAVYVAMLTRPPAEKSAAVALPAVTPPAAAPRAPAAPAAPPSAPARPTPGTTFSDCAGCPKMVAVPSGSFQMGIERLKPGHFLDELPVHTVSIAHPFAIGAFELTFAEYDSCVADRACLHRPNDHGWGRGNRPVIDVSWVEAREYTTWLSRRSGKRYRLPSEAEWEYAARARTDSRYPWGEDIGRDLANCDGCGSSWDNRQTAPVGSFRSNVFGLYDTTGNVREWVEDCWIPDYKDSRGDGSARIRLGNCELRVQRGGSWFTNPGALRSGQRSSASYFLRDKSVGFRVVREID